ncbi:MAG TPA: non-homologous end-joining DNA ligase, partial [Microthrixaceae bacterium]|nr:non-homologous end-joining DNA ligase [Microthrixaceae bacterium]
MPDEVSLTIDGHEVAITHPDKVFFPKVGHTKLDLVEYYLSVGDAAMSAMGGRPLLLQRFPNGVGGKSFFQKRIPDSAPEWLETTIVSTPNGTTARALVAADLAHIAWAVNQGCLGFHVWPSRADDANHADELRIDLDPVPGVTFDMIREAAHEVRSLFDEVGIVALPKTSGSKGMHVYATLQPRWDSYQVRAAAVAAARELARRRPDLITDAWWKEERGTRVFIDFNQNAPHKTVFGAWSVRSRVEAQVSTPIRWDEVDTVMPDELT